MKEDYLPSDVKFDVPQQLGYPPVIFEDLTTIEDVRQVVAEKLIAIQEKDTIAVRFLDEAEKERIRDEYQILLESKKPRLEAELDAIIAEAKQKIKEAKAKYNAVNTEIDDLVSQVRIGTKKMHLAFGETFRIPVGENYLYYTWVNDRFKLALVRTIPYHEKSDVFNSSTKNAKFFNSAYGLEVKEMAPQTPPEAIEEVEAEEVEE